MQKTDSLYQRYLAILNEELISATGCTEPISIALAAAKAKEVLGETPDRIVIEVSENMMKNAKSVVVPNTDNLKGIKVAVSAGIIVGQSVKQLDVIAAVSKAECAEIKRYLKATDITLKTLNSEYVLDVQITVYHQNESAKVRIINHHTNIVLIEKNADTILAKDYVEDDPVADDAKTALTVKHCLEFADSVDIDDVKVLLDNLIKNNSAIAEMGLSESFGANIGSVLMNAYGDSVHTRAKAKAAAASLLPPPRPEPAGISFFIFTSTPPLNPALSARSLTALKTMLFSPDGISGQSQRTSIPEDFFLKTMLSYSPTGCIRVSISWNPSSLLPSTSRK